MGPFSLCEGRLYRIQRLQSLLCDSVRGPEKFVNKNIRAKNVPQVEKTMERFLLAKS